VKKRKLRKNQKGKNPLKKQQEIAELEKLKRLLEFLVMLKISFNQVGKLKKQYIRNKMTSHKQK
jgi:hypothetical protein